MKMKYVLMCLMVVVMGTMLTICYYGRYGYRQEPRYYERDHHERFEHGRHHERH